MLEATRDRPRFRPYVFLSPRFSLFRFLRLSTMKYIRVFAGRARSENIRTTDGTAQGEIIHLAVNVKKNCKGIKTLIETLPLLLVRVKYIRNLT